MKATVVDRARVTVVRAAGGVVRRSGPLDLLEIVVIHRPAYDDWTIPKGKLDPGESAQAAALREVEEETGLRCRLVRELGCTAYVDRRGRDKTVCYWLMDPVGFASFVPTQEVDEVRWLTVEEALGVLTYERDRALLQAADLSSGQV
jgi:8-oxo-dGTP diphosphatase